MNENHCDNLLRTFEINAFASVVTAFRAQGELTPKKHRILNHLTYMLNIPMARMKTEFRRAVNDPILSRISKSLSDDGEDKCDRWRQEGQRLCDLLARLAPQTAYSIIANQITGEAKTTHWKNKPFPFTSKFQNYPPTRPNIVINKLLLSKQNSSDDEDNLVAAEPKLGRGCRKRKSTITDTYNAIEPKLAKLATSSSGSSTSSSNGRRQKKRLTAANLPKSTRINGNVKQPSRKKPLTEIEPEMVNRKSPLRNKPKIKPVRKTDEAVVEANDNADDDGGSGAGIDTQGVNGGFSSDSGQPVPVLATHC